ncbi:MAG: hypothetical protein AAGI23_20905 [Bacteroidota bacterium]
MRLLIFLFAIISLTQCETPPERHIFYLHGRIIEQQGIDAVHEVYGKYDYQAIIDSLETLDAVIHATVRPADINFHTFCTQTVSEIQQLIDSGIPPENISVIGASKGGVMAMYISHLTPHLINYVFLGANNRAIERENDWKLNGRVLGIYEQSDDLANRHYKVWETISPNVIIEELKINTGLGHGFLYRPINEWWQPTRKWIMGHEL